MSSYNPPPPVDFLGAEAQDKSAGIVTITLRNSHRVSVISQRDVSLVERFDWELFETDGKSYAKRYDRASTIHNIYMHRVLLDVVHDESAIVDHFDGDGLNNCRGNISVISRSQSNAKAIRPRPSSGFRGVYQHRRVWRVMIGHDMKWIGQYPSRIEAAFAYDEAARKKWGKYARLNFPRDRELGAFDPHDSPGEPSQDFPA